LNDFAHPTVTAIANEIEDGWVETVLKFWFEQATPEQWFNKDAAFDTAIRECFLLLHEALVSRPDNELLPDARTALAAVIVLDQMSRNMFRGTARAFAADPQALRLAQAAVARGFDTGLPNDRRKLFYLPFEHCEDKKTQARCVELMASLGDPELAKWAEAHKAVIDRFGRFPHRNAVLERPSTPEEAEFLKQPGSSF